MFDIKTLRAEGERLLRHALVPVVVYYCSDGLGAAGATAFGESLAVAGSFGAVLLWSWIRARLQSISNESAPGANQ